MTFFRRSHRNTQLSIHNDADILRIRTNDKHARRIRTCLDAPFDIENGSISSTSTAPAGCFVWVNDSKGPLEWIRSKFSTTGDGRHRQPEYLDQSEADREAPAPPTALVTEFQSFLDQEAQLVSDLGIDINAWVASTVSLSDEEKSSDELTDSLDSRILDSRPLPGYVRHYLSPSSCLSDRTAIEMTEFFEGRATFSTFNSDIAEPRRGKLVVRNPGNQEFSETESAPPSPTQAIIRRRTIPRRGDVRLQPTIQENPIPTPRPQQAIICSPDESAEAFTTSTLPKSAVILPQRSNTTLKVPSRYSIPRRSNSNPKVPCRCPVPQRSNINSKVLHRCPPTIQPPPTSLQFVIPNSPTHNVAGKTGTHKRKSDQSNRELPVEKDEQCHWPLSRMRSTLRNMCGEPNRAAASQSMHQVSSRGQLSVTPSSSSARTVLNSSKTSFTTGTAVNSMQHPSNKSGTGHSAICDPTSCAGDAIVRATGRHPTIPNEHEVTSQPDVIDSKIPRPLVNFDPHSRFTGVARRISTPRTI